MCGGDFRQNFGVYTEGADIQSTIAKKNANSLENRRLQGC
jgi:hypothetical protein